MSALVAGESQSRGPISRATSTPSRLITKLSGNDDHVVHIDRVQKMIAYFDILDKANVESEELIVREQTLDNLREDKYIPYEEKLIEKLKHNKDSYVRAPKMV